MFRRSIFAAALLLSATAVPAFAQCDTSFTINNRTNITVNELYFGRSTNSNWGNDRLGNGVLEAGGSRNFRPSPGGNYDFKAVFANGQERERRNIDLCSVSTININPNGITFQ